MKKFIYVIVSLVLLSTATMFFLAHKSKSMTPSLGITNDQLLPCGEKPNCVSSFNQAEDTHYIAPSIYKGESLSTLAEFLTKQGFTIIEETPTYIYTTHKSALFSFVDDVEFFLNAGQVYFRSASRVGHSDMSANRKRILRFKFQITQNL